jgi:hypothetical protein
MGHIFQYHITLEFYNIQERKNYTYQNLLPTEYSVSRTFTGGGALVGVSLDRRRFAEANGAKQRYISQDATVVVQRGCPTKYIVSRTPMS